MRAGRDPAARGCIQLYLPSSPNVCSWLPVSVPVDDAANIAATTSCTNVLPVPAVPTSHAITWMHSVVVRAHREQHPPDQHQQRRRHHRR